MPGVRGTRGVDPVAQAIASGARARICAATRLRDAIDACKAKGKKRDEHKACVLAKAKTQFDARRAALAAAVTSCSAEKKANLSAFLAKYGKRNVKAAFATCVRSKD